ncbi:hypothetical protein [uncultured Hyphomicrobium sp.]|uniref:hypothetical protein n=1 Tax=uncultured Hyphomicrobium sp. TaxID=194373 RepID=UPI0025D20645|nr:hypothetical protein [uncultured Hyphomicrobium sp.]
MRATILAIVVLAFSVNHAFAVSLAVKLACRDDYFAHCSMHAVGSPGLRQCMRNVGPRLSQRCIGALADAGEIKKAKLAAYKKKHYAKQSVAKTRVAKASTVKKYAAKKQYAKKDVAKKRLASNDDVKKRDVKKRYAKKREKQYARLD